MVHTKATGDAELVLWMVESLVTPRSAYDQDITPKISQLQSCTLKRDGKNLSAV